MSRDLHVAPEPLLGPPRPVWDPDATDVDWYRAEFEAARIMEDAALEARRVFLHAGARENHGICRQLDRIATEWAWHRDDGNRGLNGLAVARGLIRLYGGDPT